MNVVLIAINIRCGGRRVRTKHNLQASGSIEKTTSEHSQVGTDGERTAWGEGSEGYN